MLTACLHCGNSNPKQLCLVLNNTFHVRGQLADMHKHMELDKLYEQLREEDVKKYDLLEEGGLAVDEMHFDPVTGLHIKAKRLLNQLLDSADEDVMKKIEDLIERICQQVWMQ